MSFLNFIIQLAAWKSFIQRVHINLCSAPNTHTHTHACLLTPSTSCQTITLCLIEADSQKASIFNVSCSCLNQTLNTPASPISNNKFQYLGDYSTSLQKKTSQPPLEVCTRFMHTLMRTHTHTHTQCEAPMTPFTHCLWNTQCHIACLQSTDILVYLSSLWIESGFMQLFVW